ncbi:type I-B CRISPR-associated protein Cas8b1/Cst1 [Clostridium sp. MB40-C1]|uniref:type I-B CRISPR-associated protein Cas8b1/Cst1 n=1 Tax=Clostridium sp. MB40-C1 TaxID=3070996 RepID=UPI0027DEC18D|nr:type I-B CRISPR-associated protein Cas8b1/Cst1 [Clostridium sp. MB40-C1]WMJ79118.1 type I-B CRISPR-associated protein Cas8b1/Cst1 [Clostridium sp. MB40-C1]
MRIIGKIRLELSDWLYNAGIVGVVKILEDSEVSYDTGINYVEFDDSVLENFSQKYFNYFIKKYKKFTSWYKIVSFEGYIENFNKENVQEKDLTFVNNYIEDIKKKLTSNSYKSGYLVIEDKELDLLKEEKKLKKIKMTKKQEIKDVVEDIQVQLEIIKEIIKYLKKEEVKRIILAKNVIYDVIQRFWADVSFLNKNNSKKDMYIEYNAYFTKSALDYGKANKDKYKYLCFTCDGKMSKLSKPAAYDLTWISKMGVDMSKKSSHFWNFNGDSYICPICNLVYSCIPAGFTVIKSRGLFINQNSSIDTLLKINNHTLEHNTSFEELEQETYFNIVESVSQSSVEHFEKEIENIQIVKLDSDNQRRPYSFNILSKDKLRVISDSKNMLRSMIKTHAKISSKEFLNLYREVISRLYDGKNQFDLINKLFHFKLDAKFNRVQFIEMIIKINNNFLRGRGKMVHYKVINNCKDYGVELRKSYSDKKAENKLGGVTYRLLNALKTKNTARFMDTILNAYMYLNKQVPTAFVEGLQDIDKFQTIGYAFLLGLQGEEIKKDDKKNKGDIVNE